MDIAFHAGSTRLLFPSRTCRFAKNSAEFSLISCVDTYASKGGKHEERGIAVFKSNKAASSRIAKKSNGCRGLIVVTKVLESLGLKVIRFDNYQVFNNLNEVVSAIFYEVQMRVARKNDF